jgi:cell wall assembly regulator SMI1
MFSAAETLKRFWLRQGIKLNAGASEAGFAAFERKYNILMPEDLREYFATVNGFDGSEYWMIDENVITFLSLEEVKPLSEYWSPDVPDAESYFVFADYSISAHVYAIRLLNDIADGNAVVVAYDGKPIKVADAFTEFVEGYLEDNKAVLFPEPQE